MQYWKEPFSDSNGRHQVLRDISFQLPAGFLRFATVLAKPFPVQLSDAIALFSNGFNPTAERNM